MQTYQVLPFIKRKETSKFTQNILKRIVGRERVDRAMSSVSLGQIPIGGGKLGASSSHEQLKDYCERAESKITVIKSIYRGKAETRLIKWVWAGITRAFSYYTPAAKHKKEEGAYEREEAIDAQARGDSRLETNAYSSIIHKATWTSYGRA